MYIILQIYKRNIYKSNRIAYSTQFIYLKNEPIIDCIYFYDVPILV